ncbi:ATPase, T2SS/T4P/T4SS family [Roseivivax sediminis]|uniref:Type IV secretion system protein VirB11 n=1 Tax=Roseivivax sediminis TaxID=936889 RepID=A0A1I2E4R8_9RHOB|nr:ATPase, T2SS/T4P/T4SS family [Roseivivax sediminis]SFE87727.1 type IV secretion system protein VirB11 [Roseivivax sediminis]
MNRPTPKASFLASYLAPLQEYLADPNMVEVAINPDGRVWVERQGDSHMEEVEPPRFRPNHAADLAKSIASDVDVPLSAKKPIVSGKIELAGDPLRAQVVAHPVIEGEPSITFRRYSQSKLAIENIGLLHDGLVDLDQRRRERAKAVRELTGEGKVSEAMQLCIEDRLNVVVSGGTSTGKTTFARALLDMVDPRERIVTIEDAFELFPSHANTVSMKSERIPGSEKSPAKLLESSLRMRPDRIIVGELRGGEATTFLEAINTGHGGSFTTIHADTALKAIDRLAMMVLGTGLNMDFEEVRRYCANSIDAVIQLGRADGKRGIAEIFLPGASE